MLATDRGANIYSLFKKFEINNAESSKNIQHLIYNTSLYLLIAVIHKHQMSRSYHQHAVVHNTTYFAELAHPYHIYIPTHSCVHIYIYKILYFSFTITNRIELISMECNLKKKKTRNQIATHRLNIELYGIGLQWIINAMQQQTNAELHSH